MSEWQSPPALPSAASDSTRPQTSNWRSAPFVIASLGWLLVTAICTLNFLFAVVLLSEGEVISALINCLYGTLVFWIFGSSVIGVPMIFLAVRALERRDFLQAERYLNGYVSTVKKMRLHQDGNLPVAKANLALIKLVRGDYHEAELLYEDLIASLSKKRKVNKHSLTAVYLNNLACVKVAQACSHAELFDLELLEAERLANEALTIWQGAGGVKKDQGGAAYPLQVLAEIDVLRGNLDNAERKFAEVLKLNAVGKQSLFILPEARQGLYFESHLWLCYLYLLQENREAADQLCQRLISELRLRPAPVFQHSLAILSRIAAHYVQSHDWPMAERVLEQAYAIARIYPLHPEAPQIALSYEKLLEATDRSAEINEMKLWVRPVLELAQEE
ncbi:MAG: tetratricopeptide repeat protein [Cyanobacteria bacterium REEB67]|nr:tetratricopeptide repeat protein [Cyanobacteria bacterium REEB67]